MYFQKKFWSSASEHAHCSKILQILLDRIRLREQIRKVIIIKKEKMIFLSDAKLHFDLFA